MNEQRRPARNAAANTTPADDSSAPGREARVAELERVTGHLGRWLRLAVTAAAEAYEVDPDELLDMLADLDEVLTTPIEAA